MDKPPARRFAYYARLGARQQRIYRQSDAITHVPLARPEAVRPMVGRLRDALEGGARRAVQAAAGRLVRALLDDLGVAPVELEVLEVRPRGGYGELHGLYTWGDGPRPRIQVWMRTAARARVVAWKSFLRTLLHEIGHHLDLQLFQLEETFHTHGFYARENSLFGQIASELAEAPAQPVEAPAPNVKKRRPQLRAELTQLAQTPRPRDKPPEQPATRRPARRQLSLPGFD